jgi:hypothetical protein
MINSVANQIKRRKISNLTMKFLKMFLIVYKKVFKSLKDKTTNQTNKKLKLRLRPSLVGCVMITQKKQQLLLFGGKTFG